MKTYSITSDKLQGEILVTFDDKDELLGIDLTQAQMDRGQKAWLMANQPTCVERLIEFTKKSRYNMKATLVAEQEITFEAFWQRYDDKINSSKKRTKAKWDKMSKSEKQKAYNFINRYFSSIPQGTRKKYAETYLNAELWNN